MRFYLCLHFFFELNQPSIVSMSLLTPFVSDPFFNEVLQPMTGITGEAWDPFDVTMNVLPASPRKRFARGRMSEPNPPGINLDFLEKGNIYLIHAEMPGYKKDDITMSIDNGIFHIQALKKELPCEKNANYFRRERTYGHINRRMRLPLDCDLSVETPVAYCNGVVTVTIHKKATSSSSVKKLSIK